MKKAWGQGSGDLVSICSSVTASAQMGARNTASPDVSSPPVKW